MAVAVPVVRNRGEGDRCRFAGGGLFTFKATAAETGGMLLLLESREVRGKATPLHLHPDVDEAAYVLDGEIVMHIAGTDHPVGPGGFALVPRGVPHAFLVRSATAHLLCLQTPASGESFYRDASDPVTAETMEPGFPDVARIQRAAQTSGHLTLLGPPPFSEHAMSGAP